MNDYLNDFTQLLFQILLSQLTVNGAKPGMKKCKRGNGTIFTANLRKSAFNWPGKRRQVVTPDIVICRSYCCVNFYPEREGKMKTLTETKWFKSPYVGDVNLSVRKQISYKASLSMQKVSSVFSTNWWMDKVALYGSTTVSDTWKRESVVYLKEFNKMLKKFMQIQISEV